MSVVLTACFPQDRLMFLGALALWRGMSALAATLLRNCAAYAAALAGYSATIVAGDLLGATGDAAFLIAISRGSEIISGIVSAGEVPADTDLGDAPRRLAVLFATHFVRDYRPICRHVDAIGLSQIDLLSRAKHSALPGLDIGRYGPQPQRHIEGIDAQCRPEGELADSMLLGIGRRRTGERRSDRPVSPR